MKLASNWNNYELIDAGDGEKLERWGNVIVRRPDQQAIWEKYNDCKHLWDKPDLYYHFDKSGRGYWEKLSDTPSEWIIAYKSYKFQVKPSTQKHMGLFPEQSVNWDWISNNTKPNLKILNLFAYTGGATIASSVNARDVCHVDSSKGMINVAKINQKISNLDHSQIRYICEDVIKFVQREVKRGNKYDAVIMDPPAFGRGANNEIWQIEKSLCSLIQLIGELLSTTPQFVIVNSYATHLSLKSIENILKDVLVKKFSGNTSSEEIGLPISTHRNGECLILPCGGYARWEA